MTRSFLAFIDEATAPRTAQQIRSDSRWSQLTSAQQAKLLAALRMGLPQHEPNATKRTEALRRADAMLNTFVSGTADTARTAAFERLWKTQPNFSRMMSDAAYGKTTEQRVHSYWRLYTKWLRAHFGGSRIWTDRLIQSMSNAQLLDRPITYQGTRHRLTTGMDEKDFVKHVIDVNHVAL